MISTIPYLSLLLALPFIGVLFIAAIPEKEDREFINAKVVGLWISLVVFAFALGITFQYNFHQGALEGGYQFIQNLSIHHINYLNFKVGVDGLSLAFILLTVILIPLAICAAWEKMGAQARLYVGLILFLEFCLIGAFISLNILFFYIFLEASLIPLFLLIGLWGGENRIYAAFKMFLYTIAGSISLLIAFMYLGTANGSFTLSDISTQMIPFSHQKWFWWLLIVGFMIKLPLWPFHTWLPHAHVEAPTAASMLLAGITLKLGGYGILRFALPLFPDVAEYYAPLMVNLGLISIVYISLITFVQKDIKRLVAYSSVAHMGYCIVGIFSNIKLGMLGAMVQMVSHGFIAAGLFYGVGILYDRTGTLKITNYGGFLKSMPVFGGLFFILCLANIGMPGTSGFWGEFFVLISMIKTHMGWAIICAIGVILASLYMINTYKNIFWGPLKSAGEGIADISRNEKSILLVLIGIIVGIGLYPNILTNLLQGALLNVMK